jgi:hypothetical protein
MYSAWHFKLGVKVLLFLVDLVFCLKTSLPLCMQEVYNLRSYVPTALFPHNTVYYHTIQVCSNVEKRGGVTESIPFI